MKNEALKSLILYHETGGHEGDGSDANLAAAKLELDYLQVCDALDQITNDICEDLQKRVEALEEGLVPFAELWRWKVDMNDPISKWFTAAPFVTAYELLQEPNECNSCGGLNISCPEGCERDPATGELLFNQEEGHVHTDPKQIAVSLTSLTQEENALLDRDFKSFQHYRRQDNDRD